MDVRLEICESIYCQLSLPDMKSRSTDIMRSSFADGALRHADVAGFEMLVLYCDHRKLLLLLIICPNE